MASARHGLLLVQPLQAQWHDTAGQPLAQPPAARVPVRVVADLIEETHVRIEVPALLGSDRAGFIQVQFQTLLPDVPLHATWQSASSQPVLPKAFVLNAVGVSSQPLRMLLDEQLEQQRPVEGVWTLSYLMARWAGLQHGLPANGWLFLCLALPYGMRMVLLRDRVPVFSRLLLDLDPQQQVQEVGQTLKYLVDTRVLERSALPGVVLMQPDPLLAEALQAQGLNLLPPMPVRHARGVLAEVLALAHGRAPGQLASPALRRHFLAGRTRLALHLAGSALALVAAAGLYHQGHGLLDRMQQTRHAQQQAEAMTQTAQGLRQGIASSGTDIALLRLAMQVRERELQPGIQLPQPLWRLGELLQTQPQAELLRMEMALVPQACASAPTDAVAVAAPATPGETPKTWTQWSFEVRPAPGLLPRARQALLDDLGRAIAGWKEWKVLTDPARAESGAVMAGGQAGTADAQTAWRWCLAPGVEQESVTTEGAGS